MIFTNQAGSHLIVLSSDGKRAYVSNFWHGTVSVVDLDARKLIAQVSTGRGSEGLGISADDQYVFVTRPEEDEVVKVDTVSLKVVARRKLEARSSPIRVWPSSLNPGQILVNNVGAGTMHVLDGSTLQTLRTIAVGRQPIGLVAHGNFAFVANMKDNNISVIDLRDGSVKKTLATGQAPDGIAYR